MKNIILIDQSNVILPLFVMNILNVLSASVSMMPSIN